jgi:hypothetical protein
VSIFASGLTMLSMHPQKASGTKRKNSILNIAFLFIAQPPWVITTVCFAIEKITISDCSHFVA